MRFIPGDTSTASLKLGAVLEFGLIVTQIGTAVVIYPLVRRQSETVSLGYVTARIMESVFAAIGLISIISVVNVADSLASATGVDATALAVQGNSLVNTYDWAFQWGPGLVAGIGNGLMLGYLMYRSALVPPRMALLGLIGGSVADPVLRADAVRRVRRTVRHLSGLLTLPEAAWELSLGIYCAWKGFRLDSPIARPDNGDGRLSAVAAPDCPDHAPALGPPRSGISSVSGVGAMRQLGAARRRDGLGRIRRPGGFAAKVTPAENGTC